MISVLAEAKRLQVCQDLHNTAQEELAIDF